MIESMEGSIIPSHVCTFALDLIHEDGKIELKTAIESPQETHPSAQSLSLLRTPRSIIP